MRDPDVYVSPTRVPAAVALLLAVLAVAGVVLSLPVGISAALDGSGPCTGLFTVLVGVALLAGLAAVVLAIVCLARGLARYLAGFALLVVGVPAVIAALALAQAIG